MRKSSRFLPDLSATTIQRGRLPRPVQVSDVFDGFRYLGLILVPMRRECLRALPFSATFTSAGDSLNLVTTALSCLIPGFSLRASASAFTSKMRIFARIVFRDSCRAMSHRSFLKVDQVLLKFTATSSESETGVTTRASSEKKESGDSQRSKNLIPASGWTWRPA